MKKHHFWALLTGILLLLTSVVMFVNPLVSSAAIGLIIGCTVLVTGVFDALRYVQLRSSGAPASGIWWGIFNIVCGLVLISGNMLEQAAILPYIVSFWLVFIGMGRCFAWGALRGSRQGQWHILLTGLLLVAAGAFTLLAPLALAFSLNFLFAVGVLVLGVSRIVDFFVGRRDEQALPWV